MQSGELTEHIINLFPGQTTEVQVKDTDFGKTVRNIEKCLLDLYNKDIIEYETFIKFKITKKDSQTLSHVKFITRKIAEMNKG